MTHSWWWLAVDAACVYRLAILITKDTITDRLRLWVGRHGWNPDLTQRPGRVAACWRWLFELITCPWCVGLWIAVGVVALTRFAPGVWQYPAMALALSAAAGFLAERTGR